MTILRLASALRGLTFERPSYDRAAATASGGAHDITKRGACAMRDRRRLYISVDTFDRVIIGDRVGTDPALGDEIIAAIGQGAPPPATDMLDHHGRLILAGLVDGHVHNASTIGWPGMEGAPRSAAAGGVTTCVDAPYDVPHPGTNACKLADKIG
jgi:adenine deaminase